MLLETFTPFTIGMCLGLTQRFPSKLKFRRLFLFFTQNTLVFFKILKIVEGFPIKEMNKVYSAPSILGVYLGTTWPSTTH